MRPPNQLASAALALVLSACQEAGPGASGASTANAVAAGATANAIAAPPPILDPRVTLAVAVFKAASTPLLATGETTVDPGARFRVELPWPVADARLALLDAGDALVPSSGTREVGQATVLSLVPSAALTAGARLRLRVDGAATREIHAADGRSYHPVEWPLVVAGEPEAKKPAGRKARRR